MIEKAAPHRTGHGVADENRNSVLLFYQIFYKMSTHSNERILASKIIDRHYVQFVISILK